MKSSVIGAGLTGLLAGAILTAAVFLLRAPSPPTSPTPAEAPPSPDRRVAQLEEANRNLRAEVERLRRPPAPAAPAPEGDPPAPVPDAPQAPADLRARFDALTAKGMMAFAGEEARAFLEELKKSPDGRALLLEKLRSLKAGERFLAAGLLERMGDAGVVGDLAAAYRGEKDMLVRRMLSHAIAVLGEGGEPVLREAMTGDSDWGVRVNSAYGLAKRGHEDALQFLEGAYASEDTPAEYRMALLGGLADVAAPSSAPLFRQILRDTTEPGYLLMSIGALTKMKDTASIPELERLAASTLPESVRDAARKAVEAIGK